MHDNKEGTQFWPGVFLPLLFVIAKPLKPIHLQTPKCNLISIYHTVLPMHIRSALVGRLLELLTTFIDTATIGLAIDSILDHFSNLAGHDAL